MFNFGEDAKQKKIREKANLADQGDAFAYYNNNAAPPQNNNNKGGWDDDDDDNQIRSWSCLSTID